MSRCNAQFRKPVLYYVLLAAMFVAFTLVIVQAAGG